MFSHRKAFHLCKDHTFNEELQQAGEKYTRNHLLVWQDVFFNLEELKWIKNINILMIHEWSFKVNQLIVTDDI